MLIRKRKQKTGVRKNSRNWRREFLLWNRSFSNLENLSIC